MPTRRRFLQSAFAAAALGRTAVRHAAPADAPVPARFEPGGRFGHRIRLCRDRLTHPFVPEFNEEFILADVRGGSARRFSEYSGDLSGRYIGALAWEDSDRRTRVDAVVRALLRCQKQDGRFGAGNLDFAGGEIGPKHMALLWGNGRLLVGLLEYHAAYPSSDVLRAARALGDFLTSVRDRCSRPEVQKRLDGEGASGFICFTQLIEGLVLLADASVEPRYLSAAEGIIPWLQPRGAQHSHGYLTTLRGIVLLHDRRKSGGHLALAEKAFRDLLASPDYTVAGGVLEYFGAGGERSESQRSDPRDEGCSEADLVRLALQLWRATGNARYLDVAERGILNAFFFNQFPTGDFGHHTTFRRGFRPADSIGRAWWCCSMHGYRAFRDIADAVVTADGDAIRLNLFLEGRWSGPGASLRIESEGGGSETAVVIESAPRWGTTFSVRRPPWAEEMTLSVNGALASAHTAGGYMHINRKWDPGDRISIALRFSPRLHTRDGRVLATSDVTEVPVEAALYYGPWLLAADDAGEPMFFGEPWPENVVFLPENWEAVSATAGPYSVPCAHIGMRYRHGGFSGEYPVTLRPLSEQTAAGQSLAAFWLNYARGRAL